MRRFKRKKFEDPFVQAWLHFNLWSFLLLMLLTLIIGWVSDIDRYRQNSNTFLIEVVPDTFRFQENKFFPHVFISEFQGVVAGERKFFAVFFYPRRGDKKPTKRHKQIYAIVNSDDYTALGKDADHPVPILNYGTSPTMENFDYSTLYDANSRVMSDSYKNKVENYLKYNKLYGGVSIMNAVRFLYLWISLPWGLGCAIYLAIKRLQESNFLSSKV